MVRNVSLLRVGASVPAMLPFHSGFGTRTISSSVRADSSMNGPLPTIKPFS